MTFQRMLRARGRRCRTAWAVVGAVLVGALGLSRDAWAQTKTWTAGGITVTWDDAGNWSPAGVPTSLDRVLFPLGSFGPTGPYPTITLGASSVANSLVLDNNYTLSAGVLTLTTGSVYADLGVYAVMSSTLSGTAGLTKQGSGAIRLSNNANNYTGTTNIADGVLVITGQGALGSSSSTVRITDQNFVPSDLNVQGYGGGALFLDARTADFSVSRNIDAVGYGPTGGRGGAIVALGNATLSGNVVSSTTSLTPATLRTTRFISSDGMLTFSGTLNVLGTAFTTFTQLGTTNQAGAGWYSLSGGLEGTGSLEKTGVGTLFLAPVTTAGFSGAIRAGTGVSNGVSQSTIRITSSNVLGTRSNTNTGANAVLDLNGGTVEVRMDAPSLLAGGSAANAYIRLAGSSNTPLFVDHAAGSAALSGTLTLGRLDYDEGTGTLTLLSRNGYSLDAGTALSLGGNDGSTTFSNSIAGLLTFSGTAFWAMSNSTSRTMTISGNGNTLIATNVIASNTTAGIDHILTKSGAGLLTITGTASTLDGAVNVQGGALAITDFRSVTNNSGTITLGNSTAGGSLIFGTTVAPTAAGLTGTNKVINLAGTTGGGGIYANQSGANPVIINFLTSGSGSKTLTLGGTNAANNIVNAGIADGTSPSVTSVTKVGPGTWVFSGTNTYTGTTTISDGTLKLNANGTTSTVLSSTSAITFNASNGYAGGTLEFAGQAATTNVQTLGTLTPNQGGNTIRVTPGAGGSASLSFSNLVTSANSGLNIVGADATTNTVSFLAINGSAGSSGLVTRNAYWNGGDFAYRTMPGGVLRAPVYGTDATFSTAAAGAATLVVSANNDVTGDITAQTTLSVVTVRMSGNRTLTLNSGQTLTLTGAGLLGTSGTSLLTGGTLALGAQALIARTNLADDVLQVASLMTGSGGLTKNGAGVLVLSSTGNAQTGTITINEGTIRLSGSGARLGAAANLVVRDGATLDLNGVTPGTNTNQFDNMGTVTSASAATFTVGGSNGTGTSYGIVSGLVNVTKLGTGGQSWLGLSTYTGTTTIGSTGLVTVDVLADIGVASGIGRGDATSNATNAASLVFNGSTGGLVYAGSLRPLGSGDPSLALGSTSASTNRLFTLTGTGARLSSTVSNNNAIVWSNTGAIVHGVVGPQAIAFEGTSAGDNTFNPQITDAGTGANITSVSKAGAGQWNLGGLNNTYSGSTTISEGIFAINAAGALPSTSPLVLAPTSATSVAVFQASGTITRAITSSAVAGSQSITFTGTTASTTGGVGFAAHGSRLAVALGGTANPTALTWGSGGFVGTGTTQNLVLNSASSLAEIDFRNPIDLGSAARVVNVQDNTTTGVDYAIMSGALSGAGGGSLRKIGSGILQLTGASTYTGTTSVEAGTLAVRSFGSSTDSLNAPTSVGASGMAMGNSNAVTLGNGSTTGVNLMYVGAGETTDRKIRINTTTGNTMLFADGSGSLVLTNVANDMQAGAKILYLRGSSPVPNMITGTLTDSTSGTGGTLSVNVDGGGAVWILTGSNSYTGATTVSAPLGLGNDFAMGSGTASISNGSSVFAFGGDRTVSTRVNFTNNNTVGVYGDYSLTFTNVSINASANNVNVFNNIAAGKALTLVNPVTGDLTANRTWQLNGAGTTIVTGSLTTSAGSGVFGLAISKNGDGTLVLGGTGNNFNRNGAVIDVDRGTLRMGSDNAIRSQAGDGGLTLSPEVATFDTATFDLAGTQQTVNALAAVSDGTIVIDNSSSADASLTFGANNSAVTLFTTGTGNYSITDSGVGRLSLVKTGSTVFTMIPGVTLDYSGTTGVTGGSMTIASALQATTALAASGSESLLAITGGLTNPGLITNVSVSAGSTLSLLDGVGTSITNLASLSFGGGGTGATTLRMNFGDAGSDTLGLVGGTLSLDPSSTVTFFLTDLGASGNTRYDLVTSSTGGLASGTYALGATPGGFTTFELVTTDTAVYALSGDLITGQSFWTGSLGTAWNSGTANWSTDQAGTTPAQSIPGSGSDVVFVADTVATSGTLATTLEQNFRINSLSFQSGTGGTPAAVTIGPGTLSANRLEIAPQAATSGTIGITMAAGGPTSVAISAPFKLGSAQTWNVASGSQTLTVSGPLFGESAVTKTGAGTVVLSGTADATFNSGTTTVLTIAAGNLAVTNGSALGTVVNGNLAAINVSGGGLYYDNATSGTLPNVITLSGGTLSAANNAHTYSGAVSVTAPSTINMRNANGDTSVTTTRNITLSGGLTGAGSVIVLSSTTLASGNPSNSSLTLSTNNSGWSGGLDLRQGMVVLSNTGALGSGPITASGGKLSFATAGGTTFALGQNVSLSSSNAILELAADASGTPVSDMTVNVTGTFTLGNASSGTTALRLNPATDNFSVLNIAGPVILGNNASISTVSSTTRFATISGQISDGGGNYALVVNDDFAGWGQTNQTLVLTGSNTYGGGTVLASGGLRVGNRNALGTGTLTVTVASTLDAGIDLTGPNAVANAVALPAVLTTTSTIGGLTLGGTTTNTGTGGITNNIATATGTLTLATVRLADTTTARTLTIAGTGATVIGSLVNNGTNNTLTNNVTGAGSLAITGGVFLSDTVGTARTLTLSGSGNTTISGSIANNASNTLTNNTSGGGSLTLTGGVFLSDTVGTGRTLTLSGSGNTMISGTIANASGGGVAGVLAITNTGTTTLLAANTYTGTTQIDAGTLRLGVANALPTTGAVRIGNVATAGTLDLAAISQTIASLSVSSSASGVTNRIVIPTGQTLTVNGSVLLGVDANGSTTRVTGTGGGAFVVSGAAANFTLGGATGGINDNSVYADFSGLSAFTAALGSGTFRMGDNNTGTDTNPTAFTLATSNTITAAVFGVGNVSGGGQTHVLTLGTGNNVINANTVNVGQTGSYRSSGQIVFGGSDTTGTIRIRGSDGSNRATVNMVNSTAATTANNTDGVMNFSGHSADILAGTWTMASRAGGPGAATATFSFDQGTFDVTSLLMGQRTSSGSGSAIATVNLGGGESTIGSLAMAVNTSAGGTSTATLNVTGGSVTIGAGSGTAVNMATAAASRTSISTLNLTGGTIALAGNIVRSGSGGTETATITLNGARLDLGGFAIGSSSAPITLDAQTGSLGNLGQFNGGTGLAKSSAGTVELFGSSTFSGGLSVGAGRLLITGSNAYTGTTTISGGTLTLGNTNALGATGGPLAVNGGTLDLGAFSPTVSLLTGSSGGTIMSNGASLSTLTVSSIGSGTYAGVIQDGSALVALTKTGAGTLTLAGANTYSGATTVSAGALTISTTAALPGIADAGRYTVSAGATLAVGNGVDDDVFASMLSTGNFAAASYAGFDTSAGDRTYAAAGTGTMGLAKVGSNTLILTGSNSFSGGTLIAGGTLQLGTGGSVSGAIVNQGVLAFDRADAVTLSGPISGTGGLVQSSTVAAGVVTLAGTNSYTGLTTVRSGTVELLGDNSAATGGWYLPTTSAPLLNKAVTFAAGSVVVTATGGRVQIGDLATGNVTTSTLTALGSATNNGGLVIGRNSTFTIGSGGTWLQSGTMQLSPQGGYNTSMNVNTGGLFTYTGTSTIKLNPSLNNTGKSTLTIAGGTFVTSAGFEQILSSGTYSGSPTLALSNSGVLRILQDVPALTTISTGSGNFLSVALGSGGGTIDTNGFSTTIGAAISGAGGLTKAGAGTLTLSGSNAYSGGTWLTAGTLFTGHTAAFGLGAITITAGGTLDLNNLQIGNAITNDGGTVLNAGSYTGSQTVATGTATLAGGVAGLLDVAGGAVADITGPLAASGTVSVASGGLGRASGELLGRVSVAAAGTFEVVNGGSVGPTAVIQNAGTLRIDRTQFLELATAISGAGGLEKTGSGRLVLAGQNTYTGQTSVLAGQLAVNGALAGGLTVALGAEVGGSGTIAGMLTGNGAISPGNSPGILTAPQLAPTGTTSFNFEFSGTGSPAWNAASNSINDVLRLTDATTPITSSLIGTNIVNVYFNVASLSVGEVFLGGFFTDKQAAFDNLIGNATYQFFVKGDGNGGTLYNDVNYYALSSWAGTNVPGFTGITRATVQTTANFTGGTVTGQVTQFVIVPEPGTAAAASIGIGIVAWMLRGRRTRRAGDVR